jgi:hypothetical protein
MKVKTAELSGVQLDYAVAMVTSTDVRIISPEGDDQWLISEPDNDESRYEGFICYSPSTDWSQCGPLIESHDLRIISAGTEGWQAGTRVNSLGWNARYDDWFGSTPMVAICRAVVASKLGDTVDIPDELMEVGE